MNFYAKITSGMLYYLYLRCVSRPFAKVSCPGKLKTGSCYKIGIQ